MSGSQNIKIIRLPFLGIRNSLAHSVSYQSSHSLSAYFFSNYPPAILLCLPNLLSSFSSHFFSVSESCTLLSMGSALSWFIHPIKYEWAWTSDVWLHYCHGLSLMHGSRVFNSDWLPLFLLYLLLLLCEILCCFFFSQCPFSHNTTFPITHIFSVCLTLNLIVVNSGSLSGRCRLL